MICAATVAPVVMQMDGQIFLYVALIFGTLICVARVQTFYEKPTPPPQPNPDEKARDDDGWWA